MAKLPGRDPSKHSKKDPAKPTRAKAARPDAPPIDPALAELLNPAIGRGRAGVGSQTGIAHESRGEPETRAGTPAFALPREAGQGKSRAVTNAREHSSEPEHHLP